MKKKVTAMVVDDSALMRMLIKDMLASDPEITVVDVAKNGVDAVNKLRKHKPDITTLDMEMPDMSGLDVLNIITRENLTKAIMLTGARVPELAYQALKNGAVDFICKPAGTYSPNIDEIKDELIAKIKAAATANIITTPFLNKKPTTTASCLLKSGPHQNVVAIGASTGGPVALEAILTSLCKGLPAGVLITQHLPAGFGESFARRLDSASKMKVRLGEDGVIIDNGVVFLSPSDCHMTVARKNGNAVIKLVSGTPKTLMPSADKLMESVAKVYGNKAIGVILTGMGKDGTAGMKELKKYGAKTLVQDENSSAIFSMPRSVIEAGCADKVLPLSKIATEIEKELGAND
jgi:two-component system chemotaxis response regulator CheB